VVTHHLTSPSTLNGYLQTTLSSYIPSTVSAFRDLGWEEEDGNDTQFAYSPRMLKFYVATESAGYLPAPVPTALHDTHRTRKSPVPTDLLPVRRRMCRHARDMPLPKGPLFGPTQANGPRLQYAQLRLTA
jgi:hypothetical protein